MLSAAGAIYSYSRASDGGGTTRPRASTRAREIALAWEQGDLEAARDAQASLLREQENTLLDRGNTIPGLLTVSEATDEYTSSRVFEPHRPSPAHARELAAEDSISPGWPALGGAAALAVYAQWGPSAGVLPSVLAGMGGGGILLCLGYRQYILQTWHRFLQDQWESASETAREYWRTLESIRRSQHALGHDIGTDRALSNARAAEIALIAASFPVFFALRSMRAAETTLSIDYILPALDDIIPRERYLDLKDGRISTRNIAAAERGRMYRDFLTLYTVRVALEVLDAVPDLEAVEIRGIVDYADAAQHTMSATVAARLLLDRSAASAISRTSSATTVASELPFELACTRIGELRPLREQQPVLGGAPVPMQPWMGADEVEAPPPPEPLTLLDRWHTLIPLTWLIIGTAMIVGAVAFLSTVTVPSRGSTAAAPSTERVPAVIAPIAPASGSLCGTAGAPAGIPLRTSWDRYSCQSRAAVTSARWRTCLRRADYTPEEGRGCPGDERCCPPN